MIVWSGSEARRYSEIQAGVVVLAVDGESVVGNSVSRILKKFKETSRPIVVRFGRTIRSSPSHYGANM